MVIFFFYFQRIFQYLGRSSPSWRVSRGVAEHAELVFPQQMLSMLAGGREALAAGGEHADIRGVRPRRVVRGGVALQLPLAGAGEPAYPA